MCGIFGVFNHPRAADICYLGLFSIQHRGQESAGLSVSDGETLHVFKGMGLLQEALKPEVYRSVPGISAIGHARYTTAGSSSVENCQPIHFAYSKGEVSLAHNGNFVNAPSLKKALIDSGAIFRTGSDTEVLSHLIAREGSDIVHALKESLEKIIGAYAIIIQTPDRMIAVQDPLAIRPLCYGKIDDAIVISSETCGLNAVDAEFIGEIPPGYILVADSEGVSLTEAFPSTNRKTCAFEYVYFARPDSVIDGFGIHESRTMMGRRLAEEAPLEADVVIGVPDSGLSAAIGYSEISGIPYDKGLLKNRYVGRTFIQPDQISRDLAVKMKLSPVKTVLDGKRVILVDDSIVRGTTSGRIINMIRKAGATEVHMLVSSPPVIHPCFYGIDTPRRQELISAKHTLEEACKIIGADSLHFISAEGMLATIDNSEENRCTACFTGNYPTPVTDDYPTSVTDDNL